MKTSYACRIAAVFMCLLMLMPMLPTTHAHAGTCPQCGGETYPETVTTDYNFNYCGGNQHDYITEEWIYNHCDTCNMNFSGMPNGSYYNIGSCSYDEAGVCGLCGHANTCEHPDEYREMYIDSYDGYSVLGNTEHIHTVYVDNSYYLQEKCTLCGEDLEGYEPVYEPREITEEHRYNEKNKCYICGYYNGTCTHSNIVDGVCVDCGKDFSASCNHIETYEFDANGQCIRCTYDPNEGVGQPE